MSIPATMTVIEVPAFGPPSNLTTGERPVPSPAPGEVLVRVVAAGGQPGRCHAVSRQLPAPARGLRRARPRNLWHRGVGGRGHLRLDGRRQRVRPRIRWRVRPVLHGSGPAVPASPGGR